MNPLLALLTAGMATAPTVCPDLTEEAAGLPAVAHVHRTLATTTTKAVRMDMHRRVKCRMGGSMV